MSPVLQGLQPFLRSSHMAKQIAMALGLGYGVRGWVLGPGFGGFRV